MDGVSGTLEVGFVGKGRATSIANQFVVDGRLRILEGTEGFANLHGKVTFEATFDTDQKSGTYVGKVYFSRVRSPLKLE